jgi:hypothetical protein
MDVLAERLADNLISLAILITWVGLERREKASLQIRYDSLVDWIKNK